MMWVVVFTTSPAKVEIYTNDSRTDMQEFEVQEGMTKLSCPLKPSGGMKVAMVRDEEVVAECTPVGYRFEARPGVYNFNAFVAMST